MKAISFFKFLNRKIEKYNQLATNPFREPHPFVLIWVEEFNSEKDFEIKP